MIVGIDARPLVASKTGFGYFLENTLLEILNIDNRNEYILFSDREVCFDTAPYQNVTICRYHDSLLFPKSFYYYYRLASFIARQGIKLDVFWGTEHFLPRNLPKTTRKVLTMYDFTHIRFPHSTTKFNLLVSRIMFKPSVREADVVACISGNTREELCKFFPDATKNKEIVTIYLSGLHRQDASGEEREGNVGESVRQIAGEPYALFVGTIEPRKNISLLIRAAGRLKGKLRIVICGKIGWEQKPVVEALSATDNLIYLNYVTQDEKEFLLKNCFCQVQPSLYEGFGLPVIESMQMGAVALVADNSSLHELVEMPELRFETENVDSFCEKLLALQNDGTLYERARRYCHERGKSFDWAQTAEAYRKLFEV